MEVIIRFESIKSYKEINLLFYNLNFNKLIRFFFNNNIFVVCLTTLLCIDFGDWNYIVFY